MLQTKELARERHDVPSPFYEYLDHLASTELKAHSVLQGRYANSLRRRAAQAGRLRAFQDWRRAYSAGAPGPNVKGVFHNSSGKPKPPESLGQGTSIGSPNDAAHAASRAPLSHGALDGYSGMRVPTVDGSSLEANRAMYQLMMEVTRLAHTAKAV